MSRRRRNGARLLASMAVMAMFASACSDEVSDPSGDDETSTEDAGDDGNAAGGDEQAAGRCGTTGLIWAHEQTPPNMHLDDPDNNLPITSWVRQSLWEGLHGITGSTEFFPEMLASELEVVQNEDGTVTFNGELREGLVWSDGTPVTAQQVVDTHGIIMEGHDFDAEEDPGANAVYLIGDRTGYDLIRPENIEATSGTEFTFTMDHFYAGYRALFPAIFPTHVVPDAATANEAFASFELDGSPLPSTGPMLFDSLEPWVSVELTTNEDYHGSVSPDVSNDGVACVTGVTITAVADADAQVNALQAGDADFIFVQPQPQFEEAIVSSDQFTVASEVGPAFEHWGLNLFDTHLQDPLVREALALVMDKSQVVEDLYTPLFDDALPPEGLGNTYWLSNQEPYVNNAGGAGYGRGDTAGAIAKLEEAGYADSGDGFYQHPERGRLTLRVGTTDGNALRERQQEILQQQVAAAGIEIEIDNVDGAAYFGAVPFSAPALACASGVPDGQTIGEGDEAVTSDCDVWDITQFAWVGGPWPGGQSASYRCGSGNNPYGYCNEGFDELSVECDSTVGEAERADCYNELDSYVTTLGPDGDGLFMLPITQTPSFYAYSNDRLVRAAVAPDVNDAGPLVNVVDFVPAA